MLKRVRNLSLATILALGFLEPASADIKPEEGVFWYFTSNYQDRRDPVFFSTWMKGLPDSKDLRYASLPGTAFSTASETYFDRIQKYGANSQSLTLNEQLNVGIRFFDVSLSPVYKDMRFYHQDLTYTAKDDSTFKDQLLPVAGKFLRENPSETLLIRIKNADNAPWEVEDRFSEYLTALLKDSEYKDRIYNYSGGNMTDAALLMGKVRGKIVFLRDFGESGNSRYSTSWMYPYEWVIGWNGQTSMMQFVSNLNEKWNHARGQISDCVNSSKIRSGAACITYFSDLRTAKDLGSYQWFIASGASSPPGELLATGKTTLLYPKADPDFHRGACVAGGTCSIYYTGLNMLFYDAIAPKPSRAADNHPYMRDWKDMGIVAMNFPGVNLIEKIISSNTDFQSAAVGSTGLVRSDSDSHKTLPQNTACRGPDCGVPFTGAGVSPFGS